MVEQVGHRVVRTMRGNQLVARKRRPPIALAARDKYDLALFVGEPIERVLDSQIGAPLALSSARVCKISSAVKFGILRPSRLTTSILV